jgi:hypothetical protein
MRLTPHILLLALGLCGSELGVTPDPSPAWWHPFIPSIVVGLDAQGLSRAQVALTDSISESTALAAPARYDTVHDSHQQHRWTLGLRWSLGPSLREPLPLAHSAIPLCSQWHALRALRPRTLDEALDHWVATETLRALILPLRMGDLP